MRVLVLGADGQLGLALCASLPASCQLFAWRRAGCDLVKLTRVSAQILALAPDVIINAAAYTDVERAEHEPAAWLINATAVQQLAQLAQDIGALLVHISTDYVFDGKGEQPWRETDMPAPLNNYGKSKLAGEQAIIANCERHLILRTSWLHSPWRHNFIKTMLRLGEGRELLSVVCDQIGAPTSAKMLAEVMLSAISQTLAKPELAGLYHVAASGETSWYDYADFIFYEARKFGIELKIKSLSPVLSKNYPTAALRPLNSRLDTTQFCTAFGVALPDWQAGVKQTITEVLGK